jgi:hypothetical protein
MAVNKRCGVSFYRKSHSMIVMNWQFLNNKGNTSIGQNVTILAFPCPFVITYGLCIMNEPKIGMSILHSDSKPHHQMNRSWVGPRVRLVIMKKQ